jgi:formate hydrogenlyase subunit 6/NADH:ubiquinone oxidoreductase subunit I
MVPIHIMGKEYHVPASLTIMKAMEYAGFNFIRGCGCRGGLCGACGTVYRLPGDYKLHFALACQTVIEPNMYLAQIPFYPANKAAYSVEDTEPAVESILALYPEINRCVSCNTCTRSCPQDLEVMTYVQTALRGDMKKTAELSFECIMCGLCASRCPAEIVQYHIGLLCRRLYAKYLAPKAKHLADRVTEVEQGVFDKEMERMAALGTDELKALYEQREIEPA